MCGILGFINTDSTRPADEQVARAMAAAITHRGPDDEGFYFKENVAMGMRRLSIIDLATGRQPISNEDGSVWVVFNGEIYNFPELRQRLMARGHQFSTHSDTEDISHLYHHPGEQRVVPLNRTLE